MMSGGWPSREKGNEFQEKEQEVQRSWGRVAGAESQG